MAALKIKQPAQRGRNMIKTNYHTHTTYCDGVNTAEEMIQSAIEKRFSILGFSSHSIYPFASDWHIAPRETEAYTEEIRSLAEKYRSKITVLCGFEADYIPGLSIPSKKQYEKFRPDYLIGSVHYLVTEKGNFTVDESAEGVKNGVDVFFKGNARKAVCEYFYAQREMLLHGDFEIWGHPDLFRKRNSILKLFNESESWYRSELKATARAAKKAGVIAEINTGAISRGAMDDVYPSQEFLRLLAEQNVPVTVSSDAHNAESLDCAFERAYSSAKKAGYTETAYLDETCTIRFQKL